MFRTDSFERAMDIFILFQAVSKAAFKTFCQMKGLFRHEEKCLHRLLLSHLMNTGDSLLKDRWNPREVHVDDRIG